MRIRKKSRQPQLRPGWHQEAVDVYALPFYHIAVILGGALPLYTAIFVSQSDVQSTQSHLLPGSCTCDVRSGVLVRRDH